MLEIVGVLFGIFDSGVCIQNQDVKDIMHLNFGWILGSGGTRNYWRIKMTLMGFCMRYCKTSTDLVFVEEICQKHGQLRRKHDHLLVFLVDASHNISAAPRQLMNLHYLRAKCLNLLSSTCGLAKLLIVSKPARFATGYCPKTLYSLYRNTLYQCLSYATDALVYVQPV